ncbi:MAG: PEP-CTERM sorting domain-containing protein [Myxococcota bacterium]
MLHRLIQAISLLMLLFAPAMPASAASILLSADQSTYTLGETISVRVDLSVTGSPTASAAILTLGFDDALLGNATITTVPANVMSFGSASWMPSGLQGQCDQPGRCRVMDQLAVSPTGTPADPYTSFAIIEFSADAVGEASFDFPVADFFGATAPLLSVQIVPEPTTALLLAFALTGLALGSRRS